MKQVGVSLTEEQYKYIRRVAAKKYENKFSQTLRIILQEYIDKKHGR